MTFENFQDAYLYNLYNVYYEPQFINQPRGFKSRECLNLSFIITNPIDRACYLKERHTNIVFNFAEALWYLAGSNELSFIEYYAGNMRNYSADGLTLPGTAYGKKIFSYGPNNINQWDRLLELFKEDRDTKRGFIAIFDANETLFLDNIDISCTIGLQFFIREDSLYASAFMRANDAYRGIVSDVFSFTFIHELLAKQLNLKVGDYAHNVATTHVYEPDNHNVERILSDRSYEKFDFPSMPNKNNWEDIRVVLYYEKELREHKLSLDLNEIRKLTVDNYWKQIIILFALYQKIVMSQEINMSLFHGLLPIYQYFIKHKWTKLFN